MTLNIDSATECSFANPVILLKTRCNFFLKIGKLDKEAIATGREVQFFRPW